MKETDKDDLGATTQVVEYKYDLYDRRIEKAVDTTSPFDMADAAIERYVYDGDDVVLQFDGDTASDLTHRFLHGPAVDQILAQEDVSELVSSADRVLWHLADNLGTVRDLAKNDGTLGEHYEYDSFGNIQSGDTSVTRFLFTGREFDPDSGLQYNRARWYDPSVGRMLSEGSLPAFAVDSNRSRMAGNNVVNATSPDSVKWKYAASGPNIPDIVVNADHPWVLWGEGIRAASALAPVYPSRSLMADVTDNLAVAGAAVGGWYLGEAQGVLNTVNGLNNIGAEMGNGVVWLATGIEDVYIQEDWSEGMLVYEDPLLHDISSASGAIAVLILSGVGAAEIAPALAATFGVIDKVDGVATLAQGIAARDPVQMLAGVIGLLPGSSTCFVAGTIVLIPPTPEKMSAVAEAGLAVAELHRRWPELLVAGIIAIASTGFWMHSKRMRRQHCLAVDVFYSTFRGHDLAAMTAGNS